MTIPIWFQYENKAERAARNRLSLKENTQVNQN